MSPVGNLVQILLISLLISLYSSPLHPPQVVGLHQSGLYIHILCLIILAVSGANTSWSDFFLDSYCGSYTPALHIILLHMDIYMKTNQLAGTKILVLIQVVSMAELQNIRLPPSSRGSLASSLSAWNNSRISLCGANGKANSRLH